MNLKHFIIFSSTIIISSIETMTLEEVDKYLDIAASDRSREEKRELMSKIENRSETREKEYKQMSKYSSKDEVLNALTKELHNLGILIRPDAENEKAIFYFTDNLIKKGPESARLIRKMIQEYARNQNKPDWKNYTYEQFKLDVMNKIINEKAKTYTGKIDIIRSASGPEKYEKPIPQMNIEQKKIEVALALEANLWLLNEIKKNPEFKKKFNEKLNKGIESFEKDYRAEDLQFKPKQVKTSPTKQTLQPTQQNTGSSGWFTGFKNWWYGSDKEQNK